MSIKKRVCDVCNKVYEYNTLDDPGLFMFVCSVECNERYLKEDYYK